MINRRAIVFLLLCLLCLASMPLTVSHAMRITETRDLETLFDKYDVEGAFVLYDVEANTFLQSNRKRADERRFPASTFKIANSLIALETGVVADADEIIPYGGKPQPIRAWQRDMSMRDAISISNVPIYQELARRIGLETYASWLEKLDYGNRQVGADVERFWLDGPLAISPMEHVLFIARLAGGALPASHDHQQTVRDLVFLESNDRGRLYGKSGWSLAADPQIGWWVGWVERGDAIFAFALTIDMTSRADAGKREALARDLLRALDIY